MPITIKYLHIMPDSIYSLDFSNKINKIYGYKEHYFIIYGCEKDRTYEKQNIKTVKKISQSFLLEIVIKSFRLNQVYIHGLFLGKKELVIFSVLTNLQKRRYSWYVWSSDLIRENQREKTIHGLMFQKRIKRSCRRRIIRNLKEIIVMAHSDYDYAKKNYTTNAVERHAMYAFNLPESIVNSQVDLKLNHRILAGHSASKEHRYKKMFDDILQIGYGGDIISVLSYDGEEEYIDKVREYGERIFKEKFHPILDFMSYDKYMELLSKVDSGIFYGDCQNGAGNIVYLLYLGKKVFLSSQNGSLAYFREQGIKIFDIEDMTLNALNMPLSQGDMKRNREIVEYLCSDKHFKEEWDLIFKR